MESLTKRDVIYSRTLLPEHAPAEYLDREKLWNSVERIEKNANAQLARRFSLAIPNELSEEEAIDFFRRIGTYFTDQGMCFDGGIHWKKDNHHFDFLTTMRPFKPDGSWGTKEKKDYALDENGERIPVLNPKTGQQKVDKQNRKQWKRVLVDSTGWNSKEKLEEWRKNCCEIINEKNKELGLDGDIDHRSYERQGKNILPHIHQGYRVRNTRHSNGYSSINSWNYLVDRVNAARIATAESGSFFNINRDYLCENAFQLHFFFS